MLLGKIEEFIVFVFSQVKKRKDTIERRKKNLMFIILEYKVSIKMKCIKEKLPKRIKFYTNFTIGILITKIILKIFLSQFF